MSRCRVGLIGAGNVAQRHARVLRGFDDVELVGVTDVAQGAAQRLADEYGGRTFADADALLAEDLDAVYVCIPPFAHGDAERAVTARGLPMFVEKPIAVDLPAAERIATLVREAGIRTAVGHHWRYLEVAERAQRLLTGRQVRLVCGWWLDKVPPVAWWATRSGSGGPVVEQAAHVLDLMRLLAGEVVEVSAVADGNPPPVEGADIDSTTAATLRFASGAVGTLATTCTLGWKHRAGLEIYADGLALAIGEEGLTVREGSVDQQFTGDPDGARVAVDRAFVDAVRGVGDDVRVPYEQALRTHRLACAISESAATGRSVRVPAEVARA